MAKKTFQKKLYNGPVIEVDEQIRRWRKARKARAKALRAEELAKQAEALFAQKEKEKDLHNLFGGEDE